jgi:hypothetical protein
MAAIAVGTPVVPVAIRGTRTVIPAWGSRESHPGDVEVILHEPVPTDHLIAEDFYPLREDVRDAIARYVDEIDVSADVPSPAAAESGRLCGALAGAGGLRIAEPSSA